MPLITTTQLATWGRLVKSWARGLDYLTPPSGHEPPLPGDKLPASVNYKPHMTRQEFDDLIQRVAALHPKYTGFNVVLPQHIHTVVFYQAKPGEVIFRLPPLDALDETEKGLESPGSYQIRPFYAEHFDCSGGKATFVEPPLRADRFELHANRLGDYTISYCM